MSLTQYKPQFDNAYEEIFQKVLVGKEICNTRFEPVLKYGASVARVAYDISQVRVRTVTRGSASTIDAITDSSETLIINLEKESVFFISDGEITQAGPLNPGEVIGGKIAIKVASDLDTRIFAQVLNAYQTFDAGDLTTLVSSGTPIVISSTTVPQMITRMPAKLRYGANQTITNMALVVDSYAASDIEQFLLGKQFSIVESVFKNGYAGPIATAEVYISENLTATVTLTTSTPGLVNADTVVIDGVTLTAVSSIGTTAGNFLIGTTASSALNNLAGILNAPDTTSATQVALSSINANQITENAKITAVVGGTTATPVLTITAAGRIILSNVLTNTIASSCTLHAYYGKRGAIDLVIQDIKEVDMRPTADRRGTNVFSSYLAGIKTFADGAKQFLDVHILC